MMQCNTKMIDNICLRPLRPMRARFFRSVGDCCVENEQVNRGCAQLAQSLLCKDSSVLEVGKIQRNHGQLVSCPIEPDPLIGRLGLGDISSTQDEPIRSCLQEQLLDRFEALFAICHQRSGTQKHSMWKVCKGSAYQTGRCTGGDDGFGDC